MCGWFFSRGRRGNGRRVFDSLPLRADSRLIARWETNCCAFRRADHFNAQVRYFDRFRQGEHAARPYLAVIDHADADQLHE